MGRGNTASAAEILSEISAALLTPQEDPEGSAAISEVPRKDGDGASRGSKGFGDLQTTQVLSSGGGSAIGAAAAVKKLVARLPDGDRKRWRDLLAPAMAERWAAVRPPSPERDRQSLRRKIIRDHPEFPLFDAAVEEEIDDAVERGNAPIALEGCRAVLRSGSQGAPKKLQAALIALATSAAFGLEQPWQEFRKEVAAILESTASGALDPALRLRAKELLEQAPPAGGSQAGAPAPEGGLRPRGPEFQLGSVLWRAPVSGNDLRSWALAQAEAREVTGESDTPRQIALPFHPAALGDILFFQDSRSILAIRLPSLQEIWTHEFAGARQEAVHAVSIPAPGSDQVMASHLDRLVALGSEDGKPRWEIEASYDRSRKRLRILPARSAPPLPLGEEGAATMEEAAGRNDRASDRQPELPPVVTLGSPIASGSGTVFMALVRVQGEVLIHVVCIDSWGKVQWSSGLGSFRVSDHLGQIVAAVPPLESGPMIIVSTNLGAVAALDAADGTILWMREYPRLQRAARAEAVGHGSRWSLAPPAATPDLILCAPQDSDLLLALGREDGTIRWRVARDRHAFLIGTDGERCYLGGKEVCAIRTAGPGAGGIVWTWSMPEDSFALGQGTIRGDRILIPERDALVQLDGASGRPVSITLWDFQGGGGNLLAAGRHLAVAGSGDFLVYGDRAAAEESAASMGEEDRLLERAKLQLKSGAIAEGLKSLAAWSALKSSEPAANSPTYRRRFELAEIAGIWIAWSRVPGAPTAEDIRNLRRFRVLLEPLAERKLISSIEAAAERRQAGDFAAALGFVQDALRLEIPEAPVPVNDFLAIPGMEAVRGELLAIRSGPSEAQAVFATLEAQAAEALRESRRIGTRIAFRRVIDGFPFTQAAKDSLRDLAAYLLGQQGTAEAAACLLEVLRDFPDAPDAAATRLRLAELFRNTGRFPEARKVLEDILAGAQAGPGSDPKTGLPPGALMVPAPVVETARRRLADARLRGAPGDDRQAIRFPLRKRWRSPANLLASNRIFLDPEGPRPKGLEGTFFTQSREMIECRRLSDGFPLWTVELSLVPGFSRDTSTLTLFDTSRISARFLGDSILLQDQRNILSIDARTGRILWHKPFGQEAEAPGGPAGNRPPWAEGRDVPKAPGGALPPGRNPPGRGGIRLLAETVSGFSSGQEGIFVVTSRRRILAVRPDGSLLWEKRLDFDPSPRTSPVLARSGLAIFREAPVAVHILDPGTGTERGRLVLEEGADARLLQAPFILEGGTVLLATSGRIHRIDLAGMKPPASFRPDGVLQRAWVFPELVSGQAVLHVRSRGLPVLLGMDLRGLTEVWRHEKLPAHRSEISVHVDGTRLYIIHGDEKWSLTALDLRPDAARGRMVAVPLWPADVSVGTFFSRDPERRLLITPTALLVPDPGSLSVMAYDKFKGTNRTFDLSRPLTRFLRDKRQTRFAMDDFAGLLVILAEGGDCAFDAPPNPDDGSEARARTSLVRRFVRQSDDWDNVAALAGCLFRGGESEAAITLLDRTLLSESLPSKENQGRQELLLYLLGGIKEEAEAEKTADRRLTIPCRRMRTPPVIDGEMNDPWNLAGRLVLRTLRDMERVPTPGQRRDTWVGEEDLSATLYTGWDDEYFYFALDVEDNQIFPYDKNVDFWKGDCLIIGIDPSGDGGFFQRSDDQILTLALIVPKRKPPGKGPDGKDKKNAKEDEDEDKDHKPRGYYFVKKKDDNSGAVYEIAMPWSTFNSEDENAEAPAPGKRFGLSLLLTDDDSGQGAAKALSLTAGHLLPRSPNSIWRFVVPEYFPKVVLED